MTLHTGVRVDGSAFESSLTLTIEPKPNRKYEIWLSDGSNDRLAEQIGGGATDIFENKLAYIRADLEKIRKDIKEGLNKRANPDLAGDALYGLYKTGLALLSNLFDHDEIGLRNFWKATGLKCSVQQPLRLELRTPVEWAIPWEIVPLSRWVLAGPPKDESDLKALAKSLPGFSANVRHIPIDDGNNKDSSTDRQERDNDYLSGDRRIPGNPLLPPLLFLQYESAPSASQAFESINRLFSSLTTEPGSNKISYLVDGPYPNSKKYNSTPTLAGLIMEQGRNIQGDGRYCVVHVHTHGEIGQPSIVGEHILIFAYVSASESINTSKIKPTEVEVSNGDLIAAIDPAISKTETGPLIFINACGGAAGSYHGGLGLAGFLLKKGYRAVIGPRVSIYGEVAEFVARCFYKHLLSGQCDLAEALRRSRCELFETHLNPLGALYTIYGESGLYVCNNL